MTSVARTRPARGRLNRIAVPVLRVVLSLLVLSGGSGCASLRTMATMELGSPKIYSGTRLDYHAIKENDAAMGRFNATPPAYPGADLPCSVIVDTIILPVTVSAYLYEALLK